MRILYHGHRAGLGHRFVLNCCDIRIKVLTGFQHDKIYIAAANTLLGYSAQLVAPLPHYKSINMHFSTILLPLSPLLPASLATTTPLETRIIDMQVSWFSHTTCSGMGGPYREFSRDKCRTLAETDHGVRIVALRKNCVSKYSLERQSEVSCVLECGDC